MSQTVSAEAIELPETLTGILPDSKWCVVQTHPRCEKLVAAHLARYGINYFLPLRQVRDKYRRQVAQVVLPRVVFMEVDAPRPVDPAPCETARKSHKVSSFLFTGLQDQLRQDLRFLAAEAPHVRTLAVLPNLRPGQPVRVIRGPFEDHVGTLLDAHVQGQLSPEEARRDKVRLQVLIRLMNTPVSVEVNFSDVVSLREK